MPLTIAALAARKATLTFTYAGDEVNLTYHPGLYTRAFGEKDGMDALSEILVTWDVLGEDGAPYPTTIEALAKLDMGFLRAVMGQITMDVHLGPTSAGTSGAT